MWVFFLVAPATEKCIPDFSLKKMKYQLNCHDQQRCIRQSKMFQAINSFQWHIKENTVKIFSISEHIFSETKDAQYTYRKYQWSVPDLSAQWKKLFYWFSQNISKRVQVASPQQRVEVLCHCTNMISFQWDVYCWAEN